MEKRSRNTLIIIIIIKLKNEVDTAAKETIDVLKRHHQDWFDDNDSEI